jgi:L-arabonate dehydrase
MIELDVARRRIHLRVSDAELAPLKSKWKAPDPHADRGWVKLYCETVTQASENATLPYLDHRPFDPAARGVHRPAAR